MQSSAAMPSIESLRLFDSCLTLGRFVRAGGGECLTGENVLSVMDRYGIAEALVCHQHARVNYPRQDGNRALLREIRGIKRLHPVWVIEPPAHVAQPPSAGCVDPARPGAAVPQAPARKLVEEMLESGVRAARLPLKTVPPLAWYWSDLLSVLEEHRVVCFLDFGKVTTIGEMTDGDINGVREMAMAHPELPLVLSDVFGGLGLHYCTLGLVRRTPNVYIDTAAIIHYWREVATRVDPQRVLLATGAPFADPGILVHNVQYAHEIDLSAKRAICGDNLRRLLGGVR